MRTTVLLLAALGASCASKSGWPVPTGSTLSGSASLDFDAVLAAPGCAGAVLEVTVTGATAGKACVVGRPASFAETPGGTQLSDAIFQCWVSSPDTVSVRYCNLTETGDPAAATFSVKVFP